MAEGYFKWKLQDVPSLKISSAGLQAVVDCGAVAESREVMKKHGIDISKHRARQITEEMVLENDLILVMEKRQKKSLQNAFPHVRGKIHLLGKWSNNFEVPDPYGAEVIVFDECFELIKRGCEDWQQRIV